VGSFAGKGNDDEESIYDLGGNVAEWVLTRDGKGKVIGGSADCPADPKANCTAAPEYIGFRVVRGAAKAGGAVRANATFDCRGDRVRGEGAPGLVNSADEGQGSA